jgi:hypothetical protein
MDILSRLPLYFSKKTIDFLLEEAKKKMSLLESLPNDDEEKLTFDTFEGALLDEIARHGLIVPRWCDAYGVELWGEELYAYSEEYNEFRRFLIKENLLKSSEFLITELKREKGIPIYVALDGTKYLAVESICDEWNWIPKRELGVAPIRTEDIILPWEAKEVLENPEKLKKILALSI